MAVTSKADNILRQQWKLRDGADPLTAPATSRWLSTIAIDSEGQQLMHGI